jgi:hypothetical protein
MSALGIDVAMIRHWRQDLVAGSNSSVEQRGWRINDGNAGGARRYVWWPRTTPRAGDVGRWSG